MLNDRFLKLVVQVAKKSKGCFVVHSSNVEDVAVTVRESLTKLGSGFCTIIENEGNEKKYEIEKSNLPLRDRKRMISFFFTFNNVCSNLYRLSSIDWC